MAGKQQNFKTIFLAGYKSAFHPDKWADNQSETGFQRGKSLAERDMAVGKNDGEAAFMYYMVEGEAIFWTDEQKAKYK